MMKLGPKRETENRDEGCRVQTASAFFILDEQLRIRISKTNNNIMI